MSELDLDYISREFREIAIQNAWQAYHTPKNLASAVAVEVGELLAEFQWLTPEQSLQLSPDKKAQVASEVADVIMYLTELCNQLSIDMSAAVQTKIQYNKKRFAAK